MCAVSLADLDDRALDAEYASRFLTFDIETIPARVEMTTYDLKLRNPYIHHSNVVEPGGMASWSAKWLNEPNRVWHMNLWEHGEQRMLAGLHQALTAASYVITYNGDRFDLQKARGYFARAGLPPFTQPRSIDLIKTVRTFGWESNSLDYACRMMGVRRKIDNDGVKSIAAAIDGDRDAQKRVRTYNNGDVYSTEELYLALRPWIKNHPVIGYPSDNRLRCPRCLSLDHERVGVIQAVVMRYAQYRCSKCTGLFRSMETTRISDARAL